MTSEFQSTIWAVKGFTSLSPPPGSPQGSTARLHFVHMRGIPYNASGEDIVEVKEKETVHQLHSWFRAAFEEMWFHKVCLFFAPPLQFFSPLMVSKILLECGSNGRLNGEADVFFTCHQDAVAAISRDRKNIGKTQNPFHFKSDTKITQCHFQEAATSSSSSTRLIPTRGEESRTAAEMFAHHMYHVLLSH